MKGMILMKKGAIAKHNLDIIKSVDKEFGIVGDILVYSILINNISGISIGNTKYGGVVITDILSPEVEFIPETVTVNGVPKEGMSIIEGVDLGEIDVGKQKEVKFQVKIISDNSKIIYNHASVTYGAIDYDGNLITGMKNSNIVHVEIEKADIVVKKSISNDRVSLNDEIECIVSIKNVGTLEAINVIFKDELPEQVAVIPKSFYINDEVVNSVNICRGVYIGDISVGEVKTIRYKLKVEGCQHNGFIITRAKGEFGYVFPNGMMGKKVSEITDESSAYLNINLCNFNQINIDGYLSISHAKPNIDEINKISAKIEIVNSHVIRTYRDTSNEGKTLSGYKLIVNGKINKCIEYTACDEESSVHSEFYSEPFSSYIILEENYKIGTRIEVEGIVEQISFKKINRRCLFNYISLLLTAKIYKD